MGIKGEAWTLKRWARKSQVGTIDEIIAINREVENTQLVIDWGHLHALHQGTFKSAG